MLVLHIRSLTMDTLARRVYEEQKTNNWPGLAKETTVICSELGVEDCTSTSMSISQYRKSFTAACQVLDERRLRSQAEGKEKCEKLIG